MAHDEGWMLFLPSVQPPFVFPPVDFNEEMHYCAATPAALPPKLTVSE